MMNRTLLLTASLALVTAGASASWTFGILTDTQGASDPSGVSTRMMIPVVDRFVNTHEVDMLISIGDLTEDGTADEFAHFNTTALPLANAGIPFYPTRGNHDDGAEAGIPGIDPLFGPVEYADTTIWDTAYPGLSAPAVSRGPGASYTFEYNNAKFVSLDIYGAAPSVLIGWLNAQQKESAEHMFVYAHEPFFGRAREGVLGDDPMRMQILSQMAANGASFYFSGHDHQYSRSAAVDGQEVIINHLVSGSASEKWYRFENEFNEGDEVGAKLINDEVGYTVVEVDGPFVTLQHYSSPIDVTSSYNDPWTPAWYLADRFTYSTNGDTYAVEGGGTYAGLTSEIEAGDGFVGTRAEILAGENSKFEELVTDPDPGLDPVASSLGNIVSFGWMTAPGSMLSDILYLGGMDDAFDSFTEVFVLTMSYNESAVVEEALLRLFFQSETGWVEAVAANEGGDPAFVLGAWTEDYDLGTYGVDTDNDLVWAVVNRNGKFAIGAIPEPSALMLITIGLGVLCAIVRRR